MDIFRRPLLSGMSADLDAALLCCLEHAREFGGRVALLEIGERHMQVELGLGDAADACGEIGHEHDSKRIVRGGEESAPESAACRTGPGLERNLLLPSVSELLSGSAVIGFRFIVVALVTFGMVRLRSTARIRADQSIWPQSVLARSQMCLDSRNTDSCYEPTHRLGVVTGPDSSALRVKGARGERSPDGEHDRVGQHGIGDRERHCQDRT